MANKVYIGTGRRKSSIAQVKMVPGKGKITVNGRDVRDFFPYETNVMDLMQPLVATSNENNFDIEVKVNGGGFTGQSQALRLAIARALVKINAEDKKSLKDKGFLTRDARAVERKKPGRPKARRRFQFSKR